VPASLLFKRHEDRSRLKIAEDPGFALKVSKTDQSAGRGVQFVLGDVFAEAFESQPDEPQPQLPKVMPGPWNAPNVLRSARVDLDNRKSLMFQALAKANPPHGQGPHRAERNREKRDFVPSEFEIAGTVMSAVPIFDRTPAGRQIQRCIDGHEVGLFPPNKIEDVPVLKKKSGRSFEVSQAAGSGWTAGDPGQVDAHDGK
jgi:hypothetical protein